MWIRCQNREKLEKVSSVWTHTNLVVTINGEDVVYLGKYETEKRALEVLDKIQEFIIRGEHAFTMPEK